MNQHRICYRILLSGLITVTAMVLPSFADELPDSVRLQLEEQAKSFARFEATWSCNRKLISNDSKIVERIEREAEPGLWLDSKFHYRTAEGRYHLLSKAYLSTINVDGRRNPPQLNIQDKAFDGSCHFTTSARPDGVRPTFLHITPLDFLDLSQPQSEIAVSFPKAAGLQVPEKLADHGLKQTGSLLLSLVDANPQKVSCEDTVLNQHPSLLVTVSTDESVFRFYLDPLRKHSVVRLEECEQSGEPKRITEVDEFTFHESIQQWVPVRFQITQFILPWPLPDERQETPVYVETVSVDSLSTQLSSEQFHLDYSHSGLRIADKRLYTSTPAGTPTPYFIVSMEQTAMDRLVDRLKPEMTTTVKSGAALPLGWLAAIALLINVVFIVRWWRLRSNSNVHSIPLQDLTTVLK